MGNFVAFMRPNCRISRNHAPSPNKKVLRTVKADGKVLEYQDSLLVRDLLSKFDGNRVGVSPETSHHIPLDQELRIGSVYHLLPLANTAANKLAVAKPSASTEGKLGSRCRRIKMVITKQQLHELLSAKVSVEEALSTLQRKEEDISHYAPSWKPQLETIRCRRIKKVITKQQLHELLSARVSVEEALSTLQRKEEDISHYAPSWKPQLETIPEGHE